MREVAVLFARADSIYKTLLGCDVWDAERDARLWPGGAPGVYHPPCRGWGRMRGFAIKVRPDEKALALWSVKMLRKYGGVLEHPAHSTLWEAAGLPKPMEFLDEWGGGTVEIKQFNWGHRAEKKTWLYICGLNLAGWAALDFPKRPGKPIHCIRPTKSYPRMPSVTKPEREKTPPALAEWLVELARRTTKPTRTP